MGHVVMGRVVVGHVGRESRVVGLWGIGGREGGVVTL
jgi:hypothetical protein